MADNKSKAGTKIKAVPKDKMNIGIDVDKNILPELLKYAEISSLDISKLENFTNITQNREQIYQVIDTMAADDQIAAILESYVEDACEPNDSGKIMWAESDDAACASYVNFLLDSLCVNKNMYKWMSSFIKYGDIYWKLYRKSDYDNAISFMLSPDKDKEVKRLNEGLDSDDENAYNTIFNNGEDLTENVNIEYHSPDDHYVHYIEMESNPGDMYELTKFGKTWGFIKAPAEVLSRKIDAATNSALYNAYQVKKKDVTIALPTDYVHACLDDTSSRVPEEIDLFMSEDENDLNSKPINYTVKRGQSLLYNSFKIWRLLRLLEMSVMLNRITKSSVVRIIELEVGDMSKEAIREACRQIKQAIEQKSAIAADGAMTDYNNPGPVENTIVVPVKGELGKINTQEIGTNDADPKSLADLDYFSNRLYGSFRVPKQYFANTDDGAGFSGGESLAIISAKYGKGVKRYQNGMCQGITDVINLYLLDKGLSRYVNKFVLKMQAPTTNEEKTRREAEQNKVGVVRDLMQILSDTIDDEATKLKLLKVLLADASQSPEVIKLIEAQIKALEADSEKTEEATKDTEQSDETNLEANLSDVSPKGPTRELSTIEDTIEEPEIEAEESDEDILPTFQELGIEDATDLGV